MMQTQLVNRTLLACLLLMGCLFAASVQAADVDGVRLWRAPDHTRVVFDLSAPVQHRMFTLSAPERVVVDIEDTRFRAALDNLDLTDTPINSVRHAPRGNGGLRVVFDLSAQVDPKSFVLERQAGAVDRLVLDLFDKTRAPAGAPPPVITERVVEQADLKRDIIIAVDAGHGGEDPGAIGPNGLREKDVVMDIARELVKKINARQGFEARLVRTGDYYVALRERRNIARRMQADLFISVHADAFTKPQARGASVFALSRRGATSEMARFLAQRENESDIIGGVGNVSLDDKDEMLAGVLVDLSMTATLGSSLQAGSFVLNSIGQMAHLHKKQVEQAGFAVLKSPDVPSILVETGFISNPGEARNLASRQYRARMADQLFRGIEAYFQQFPPEGSLLAWQKANGQTGVTEYTIARGDTLSGIAKRFNTSVSRLQQANGLDNNQVLRVGQTLRIPTS